MAPRTFASTATPDHHHRLGFNVDLTAIALALTLAALLRLNIIPHITF